MILILFVAQLHVWGLQLREKPLRPGVTGKSVPFSPAENHIRPPFWIHSERDADRSPPSCTKVKNE
jgi:hypothetical protein